MQFLMISGLRSNMDFINGVYVKLEEGHFVRLKAGEGSPHLTKKALDRSGLFEWVITCDDTVQVGVPIPYDSDQRRVVLGQEMAVNPTDFHGQWFDVRLRTRTDSLFGKSEGKPLEPSDGIKFLPVQITEVIILCLYLLKSFCCLWIW